MRAVRARGVLVCGVNQDVAGFAFQDSRGIWRGFDVDFCRAVSAAVFGRADRVRFAPLSAAERFNALRDGRVDLLVRNTSVSFSRDAGAGLDFPAVTYYDGQGFLARRALNLTSATELNGARVCVQGRSTSEQALTEFAAQRGLELERVILPDAAAARAAYAAEQCDAYTADISLLASARSQLGDPNGHVILPEVISKEPLGPVVRDADPAWADLVRWTVHATVLAEELGITSDNVDGQREAAAPEARRLLGLVDGSGGPLGLKDSWAYDVVRQLGNYGEIFNRNLGAESALRLERGLNAPWTADPRGLMYAPPMR